MSGSINWASIEAKVKAYSETSAGKAKMNQAVRGMRKSGKSETAGGYEILSYTKMRQLADELIDTITMAAMSYGLPGSVMSHFDSLAYMVEEDSNGDVTYRIFFGDELGRPSLAPRLYDGVDNIVALFNNGYVARDRVYGMWNGEMIASKQFRQTLSFMQDAVDNFVSKYAGKFNITVELGDEYNGGVFDGSFNAGDTLMGR